MVPSSDVKPIVTYTAAVFIIHLLGDHGFGEVAAGCAQPLAALPRVCHRAIEMKEGNNMEA